MENYRTRPRSLSCCALWWLLLLLSGDVVADTFSERRAQVGLKLFRTFVSAHQDIARHLDASGQLPIAVLHSGSNRATAERYQSTLTASMPALKKHRVSVETRSLKSLLQLQQPPPAAVFVAEKLSGHERASLVEFSITQRVAVFSPFEGDVEHGILGGLSVEAKVRPLVNMQTLRASRIPLKDFYLSVSRRYEKQ